MSLFAIKATNGTSDGVFGGGAGVDNTVSIYTTERGSSGPIVSLNKALLLSAITFDASDVNTNLAFGANGAKTLATSTSSGGVNLSEIEVSFFTKAIENIATLRAENGGTVSRFNFAYEQANRTKATLKQQTEESWMWTLLRKVLARKIQYSGSSICIHACSSQYNSECRSDASWLSIH